MPPRRRRRGGGRPRAEIVSQVLGVLEALRKPHTAAELAERTGLHLRTVYRILRTLPDAGIRLRVTEPVRREKGRPVRFYRRA